MCIVDIYLSKVKLRLIIKIHLKLNFGVLNVMYLFVALKQDPIVSKITIIKHNTVVPPYSHTVGNNATSVENVLIKRL